MSDRQAIRDAKWERFYAVDEALDQVQIHRGQQWEHWSEGAGVPFPSFDEAVDSLDRLRREHYDAVRALDGEPDEVDDQADAPFPPAPSSSSFGIGNRYTSSMRSTQPGGAFDPHEMPRELRRGTDQPLLELANMTGTPAMALINHRNAAEGVLTHDTVAQVDGNGEQSSTEQKVEGGRENNIETSPTSEYNGGAPAAVDLNNNQTPLTTANTISPPSLDERIRQWLSGFNYESCANCWDAVPRAVCRGRHAPSNTPCKRCDDLGEECTARPGRE